MVEEERLPYTTLWAVSVRYLDRDEWKLEGAYRSLASAARAIERFHDVDDPPIQWLSVWGPQLHDTNEPCPGFLLCEECDDWRGFVDGSGWYRIKELTLWDDVVPDRWRQFSALADDWHDHPDYRPDGIVAGR